ncbi:AAA family ATPase [Mucilaginibacter gossypii]|uniref:AAA family ATPase n=1 Tax=Mucilaginibacter gossypii TaxID=551996 RepID=UPI000DCCC83C|nr:MULTISPECIES: ATP-binding protein [Mucilaginibacter]QTE40298.1 AAA family ATPase [Mucilaginibacter gossypii]RAV57581.1 recombinase RecF [Mucilaginibacter rubeus]
MINKISISNFKSIRDLDVELGRVNVFIGENGSGKSNILEAVAMASASNGSELNVEGLFNKGVRVTKPSLTFNSFLGMQAKSEIKITIVSDETILTSSFTSENPDDIYSVWEDKGNNYGSKHLWKDINNKAYETILTQFNDFINNQKNLELRDTFIKAQENDLFKDVFDKAFKEKAEELSQSALDQAKSTISDFLIYNINTNSLRGINNDSKKQPLGINGEGLDVLLSTFSKNKLDELTKLNFISWLKKIDIDASDALKNKGYKLGRSNSELYFMDKFMQKKNNLFAAENANEGALHVLFYLALFISEKTPKFFAIDNIENALNPSLCRQVIKNITELSKKNDKQVLITTHNPAVIDGLNLHDDEQRLFVVKRTDEGYTKVERIKMKPNADDQKYKLSELWMRGYLGGLPSNIF